MPDHSQPAIAILGAGPIGLEAALYARYLGYQVTVYERNQPGANVSRWGHVRMFTPWQMNCSSLGLAALAAQSPNRKPLQPTTMLTGDQWIEEYLHPLAESDLLRGHIHSHHEVLAISRTGALKTDRPGTITRSDQPMRILLQTENGEMKTAHAQIILDTTGVFGNPNWLGPGGAPARGESELRSRIVYEVPDVLQRDQATFRDKHTLVVGSGYSAATTVLALTQLQAQSPQTQITWLTRKTSSAGPLSEILEDPLPERAALTVAANQLAIQQKKLQHLSGVTIDGLDYDEAKDQFQVQYETLDAGQPAPLQQQVVDRIVANVGYRPDNRLFQELHVHQCYATSGPMKLAAALMAETSEDCLQQATTGAETLVTAEPDFYVLGNKSYGRNPHFLFARGLDQIQQLFTIIGKRDDLNLYESMPKLVTKSAT